MILFRSSDPNGNYKLSREHNALLREKVLGDFFEIVSGAGITRRPEPLKIVDVGHDPGSQRQIIVLPSRHFHLLAAQHRQRAGDAPVRRRKRAACDAPFRISPSR